MKKKCKNIVFNARVVKEMLEVLARWADGNRGCRSGLCSISAG